MPRFTPDFIDELKARLRPSDVIGRHVKLRKQGNEWSGLSPFTNEKTPSFFVNDHKGFFHCFSSGKHGDVIGFLQETQNLTFTEAVTRLAEEAGVPLPENEPGARKAEEQRKGLIEALVAAQRFFAGALRRGGGRAALDYLEGRGVTPAQMEAFGVGLAPAERTALKTDLINKGFSEQTLVDAGLLIRPEGGGATYDRFRGRIMFPIYARAERVIAFGGRALDPAAKAKYLNSPETPVFHKGDVLYNFEAARGEAGDRPLIVCEGYMDVVALWGAGFKTAVAPLGTALTERQMALLWRVCDEPVLCFDGDAAGLRAAHRSIDRALPLLQPGKSLRFAFLPAGEDPDDVVRRGGAAAFQELLNAPTPLADVLFDRERDARPQDTPERRAAFRRDLRERVRSIADKDVRQAYADFFAEKLQVGARSALHNSAAAAGGRAPYAKDAAKGRGAPRAIRHRTSTPGWATDATLVLAAVRHPALVERLDEEFFDLALSDSDLQTCLNAVVSAVFATPGLDSADLTSHLRQTQAAETIERLLTDRTLNAQSFLRPDADLDEAEWGWRDALRRRRVATEALRDLTESAAHSFTDGEARWKAAVAARDDLLAAAATAKTRPNAEAPNERGLEDRLARMGHAVGERADKRNH